MEVILKPDAEKDVYSYVNKERCEEFVGYLPVNDLLARKAQEVALAAWVGLGCRDAGRIDLRADANGVPNFMEVNPLAGIHPEHSDLPILCKLVGIGYHQLFEMIMTSALERVQTSPSISKMVVG
jgi:D-alanine-D-alanine ligase